MGPHLEAFFDKFVQWLFVSYSFGQYLLVALLFLFLPFPFWMHAFSFIKFGRVFQSFLHNFVIKI